MSDLFAPWRQVGPACAPSESAHATRSSEPCGEARVVVLDECVLGLGSSNGIGEVFPDFEVIALNEVSLLKATDSQVSEFLAEMRPGTLFVTADTGGSFPSPNDGFGIIRFSSSNSSTATKLGLLWRLSRTRGFRCYEAWFGKDIRLADGSFYFISQGSRSGAKELFSPHPNSPAYRRFEEMTR